MKIKQANEGICAPNYAESCYDIKIAIFEKLLS